MLRPRFGLRAASGADPRRPLDGHDRAMDVLQYGMALLAFAGALLLAALR